MRGRKRILPLAIKRFANNVQFVSISQIIILFLLIFKFSVTEIT